MLWINFIHLYQPANSQSERIKEAAEKSYYRLTRLLEEHPDLHFTANISGCLLERLREGGFSDLFDRWARLIAEGRLELVGSAAYHGFLPLLPESEVLYQIKRQEEIAKEILGVDLKGHGFFLPELAYTPALAKLIKQQGYSWLILDEASLPSDITVSGNGYIDKNSGLKVVVRQRSQSNAYAPDLIQEIMTRQDEASATVITATDAELYGLRHEDPTAELEKIAALPALETKTVSKFLEGMDLHEVSFISASWETNPEDRNQPFSVWLDRHNTIQKDLWRLAELALAVGEKYQNDPNFAAYRWHLDRGLASCMFWWASGRDFFHNMGPVAWSPDEVENGLNDLIRSIRSMQSKESRKEKLIAEKLVAHIREQLWKWHWQKYF